MNRDFFRGRLLRRTGFIIGGVVLAAGLAFLFGFVVLYLWNWLMPEIFGLPAITYMQAWGLVLLSHILFKSGGHGGGHHKHHGHRGRGHWGKCSPEEHLRRRFCRDEKEDTETL